MLAEIGWLPGSETPEAPYHLHILQSPLPRLSCPPCDLDPAPCSDSLVPSHIVSRSMSLMAVCSSLKLTLP